MERKKKHSPLFAFVRSLNDEEREMFAALSGTTMRYVYQLAGAKEPNPTLRMAIALRDSAIKVARVVNDRNKRRVGLHDPIVPFELEQLAINPTEAE